MKSFIHRHGDSINGVLSGFDRLVLRGTLRTMSHRDGMILYLSRVGVLLKEFGKHVESLSQRLKQSTQAVAKALGQKVQYLPSSQVSKEEVAKRIADERGITEGPVCILSCVEVCRSYEIYRDRETKRIRLEPRWRKCLFYYHYSIHPIFGFINARIQTWVPFPIQVCVNGREWLSRQMDAQAMSYVRRDNCFPWLDDPQHAQELLDEQLRVSWPELLDGIARQLNPIHAEMFERFPISYYWSVYQSEWATDILFRDADTLAKLYPKLVQHGIASFASPDVMRFLGKKTPNTGKVHPAFKGEIVSSLKARPEGVRINHSVNGNSIKLYDKQGSVLRAETTINNPRDFRVYRRKEGQTQGPRSWQKMRKGIADLHRRAQVSRAANERYIEALATVSDDTSLAELTKNLCRPTKWKGKRVRPLRPWSPEDGALLEAVNRGEFNINGFRNRDLRRLLFAQRTDSPQEQRRRSRTVTRYLRLLRAHGLIRKLPGTHRYVLTLQGYRAITALLCARNASVTQLTKEVA